MSRTPLLSSSIGRRVRRLWRQYGIFWLGAIAVGLTAVFYARLIDFGYNAFLHLQNEHRWLTLFLTPAVAALRRRRSSSSAAASSAIASLTPSAKPTP